MTPEVVAWQVAEAPAAERHRLFVAEVDGRLVGTARTGLFYHSSMPDQGYVSLAVEPAVRGRGVGSALLTAAEEHLTGAGASAGYAWVVDEDQSRAFATRRGYRLGRTVRFQRLDLDGPLPLPPELPGDVELRTARSLGTDPRPLYEADVEATRDEPSDVPSDAMRWPEWLATTWERPDLDLDLTTIAVVDGEVVAFCLAETDGRHRYWSGMTGARRAFRGRGLAKLVKHDSLRRARAAGYTEAFTSNDAGNAPMLSVNRWLGYQPCGVEHRGVRELSGTTAAP